MAAASPSPIGVSRGVVMVDVARLAGVSQKTVSRVVNGAPHVRPDVRERVTRAIEELGYRPNVAAQALARERSHTIGVLALGTRFFGPSRRVFTLEHEARRLGYTMALTSVPDLSARSVADGIDALLKRGVEGLVVEVPTHLIDIDPAQLAGLPVVTSAGWITGVPRQAVVDVDQEEACRELTRYLLGLGHGTVWHVAGPRDWDAAQKRLLGWRSALHNAGLRTPRVFYGDWSAASGYEQGRKLAARDDVTAIFAANDHMAMGILRAFYEAGREIPGDVSLVGFDDVPEAEFQMVPLTTVGIDADRAAQRILAELLQMIEGAEPPAGTVTLPGTELIIRRSSGPVRRDHRHTSVVTETG
ncbi:MAG TPA: LacI family DNA-binding transcriptional regulator [Propionibacteriaceae bacterium]|nr:LacI family DNA-binding transcriptional regulator [Propionibacteriaceae bacterium]